MKWSKKIKITFDLEVSEKFLEESCAGFSIEFKSDRWIAGDTLVVKPTVTRIERLPDKKSYALFIDNYILDNCIGEVIVKYDNSIGKLVGANMATIESFSTTFTPTEIFPRPQPTTREEFALRLSRFDGQQIMVTVGKHTFGDSSVGAFRVGVAHTGTINVSGIIKP